MLDNQTEELSAYLPPIDPDNPPIAAIRDLLLEAFTVQTLQRFCYDRPSFRELRSHFSSADGLADMVDRVIDFCGNQLLWGELLAGVHEVTPRQLDRFTHRLLADTEAGGKHSAIYQALQLPTYVRLPSHHIRHFEALVAAKTEGFVGRQFVFDALDKFLRDNRSGYYVILGEPGIGKTALLAQLVKTRGYVHHFNVIQENICSPRQFLANACAQMVARYQLPHQFLPDFATEDPGFLVQCLGEAAARPPNLPVVLVIDALDESDRLGLGPGRNLLHLPFALPEGAYIVVTSRPLDDLQLQVSNCRELFLKPDSEGNLLDIRTYIANYLRSDGELRTRLADWRLAEEAFVRALVTKSEGNFIYLRHVLRAIAEGRFREGTVEELPQGLMQYYRRHWRQMQIAEHAEFDDLYAPIVCMLAVVREPVTVEQLQKWTGREVSQVRHAIRQWREFLEENHIGGERKYRVYHTSFKDFLSEQMELKRFRMMIATYYRELAAKG